MRTRRFSFCPGVGLLGLALGLVPPMATRAMGLRSFVALPVDKGGVVARLQWLHDEESDRNDGVLDLAYGWSANQTLLLGLPYRLSPRRGGRRRGDLGLLYRRILWRVDRPQGTTRVGVLAGLDLSGDREHEDAARFGVVASGYRGRHEIDADLLWRQGFGARDDGARYDLSWQYRLSPAQYPEWGGTSEWNSVVELNGRWRESGVFVHQATLGLQWVHPRWVLEAAVYRDLNGLRETHLLLSGRWHF